MTQPKIASVDLNIVDTAKSYGKVPILHVYDKNHAHSQFTGSSIDGGYFTELLTSRPDIIGFLAPATPAPLPGYGYHRTRSGRHDRGLHIMCTDTFGDSDWVIAVEEDCGCDPGYKLVKILGADIPQEELLLSVRSTLRVSAINSFMRYRLGGSVLGDYRF